MTDMEHFDLHMENEELSKELERLREENAALRDRPSYVYIGRGGKPTTGRALEDRAEAAEAEAACLRDTLREVSLMRMEEARISVRRILGGAA